MLLDAMPAILREHPEMQLIVAGRKIDNGYYDELTDRIKVLGLMPYVRFIGAVPESELIDLYRRCELFVFPSTVETFGNPLVEAMACGAPIACSRTAAMPEIVEQCAELFDPSDGKSISDTILGLLDDEDRRVDLGRRGTERAKRFSWKVCADETASVFRRCAPVAAPSADR